MDGKIVKKYDSIKDAAKAVFCSAGWLSVACRNNKTAKGYKWKRLT